MWRVRIRIDLAYDGTDFSGWAAQPGLRTVQGVLEEALGRILRLEHPRVTVAGRTDAGVHARAQVVHVDVPESSWSALPGRSTLPPEESLVRRLNAVLPSDVAASRAAVAPDGFDARFSALWRRYSYRVIFARDPLRSRYALVHEPVALHLMNASAALLVGERDFTPFCKARPGASAVRTLQHFEWREIPGGVLASIQADAFCHNMVRSLVGACLTVGRGKRDLDWLRAVAGSAERSPQIHVAPGHPLILEEVGYPEDAHMAARAERTRARRSLPEHS